MKTMLKAAMLTAGLFVASAGALVAQDAPAVPDFAAPAAAPAAPAVQSTELAANPDQSQPAATKKSSTGFWAVVTGSGGLGVILWLCLFGAGVASIYFVFDCSILFKADKMIPKSLVDKVSAAMAEGDVLKALKACESEPGPLANILSSAFSHVEEGFDVIQEAISAAADIETERVMQRINWISVCGNIARRNKNRIHKGCRIITRIIDTSNSQNQSITGSHPTNRIRHKATHACIITIEVAILITAIAFTITGLAASVGIGIPRII